MMEVSSQGLKMHRVDGIDFDYGMFTNISNDHISALMNMRILRSISYWKLSFQLLKQVRVAIKPTDED